MHSIFILDNKKGPPCLCVYRADKSILVLCKLEGRDHKMVFNLIPPTHRKRPIL
ncbi:hypothetical protein DSCW_51110 [Desulfosarcina widdelii]|uniref:Uncharacterized protein n=1 Tax=Desulfosarcina widdelii TaxID=947919 RepID=A0A5K7ZH91_9BACT|nr:hypothetical protein DSCW_51110 [Desulfosarcina widdelii]